MAYVLVEDFRAGLDTRRTNVTSVPGSLVTLTNAHISRGGEIEKRKAFVKLADLPSNTTGLAAAAGQIYVFGSAGSSSVSFASGTPSNINYIQFQHPTDAGISTTSNTVPLDKITSVDFFNGYIYASARYTDGRAYHYYQGQTSSTGVPVNRVLDWADGRARSSFTINGGTAGGTAATGSFDVTDGTFNAGDNIRLITVNSVRLWSDQTVVAHTGTNSTTATNVASAINAFTSTPNYTASASGSTVTITASDVGQDSNGFQVAVGVDGQVTVGNINHMSGGVSNAITALTVNGIAIIQNRIDWATSHSNTASLVASEINRFNSSPELEAIAVGAKVVLYTETATDAYNGQTVAVTKTGDVTTTSPANIAGGVALSSVQTLQPGHFVRSIQKAMMSVSDSIWHFSDTDDPTEWNVDTGGSGFVNLSNHARGSEELQCIAQYFKDLAIFAKQSIQIWSYDPLPTVSLLQVLNNTGALSPNSVVEFGDSDVFYLSESGIRSLRARDSSNSAHVGDIGNPIDDTIQEEVQTNRSQAENAVGILDPRDGRYLLAIGNKIYVFSYFPGSKVSAWSVYEPGFTVTDWAFDGKQVLCRAGDALYSLGGENNTTYDSSTVTVQMPFLDAQKPATNKDWTGIDAVCENDWTVSMATDPTDIGTIQEQAVINRTTYGLGRIPIQGFGTHIAIKMVCNSAGSAKIGNVSVHYEGADAG